MKKKKKKKKTPGEFEQQGEAPAPEPAVEDTPAAPTEEAAEADLVRIAVKKSPLCKVKYFTNIVFFNICSAFSKILLKSYQEEAQISTYI